MSRGYGGRSFSQNSREFGQLSALEGCPASRGFGEVVIHGRGIGRDDDTQAGFGGGGMSGHRVLKGECFAGGQAESGECGEVEVGRRFSVGHVLAAEHGVKVRKQAAQGELALDVGVAGVRCDCQAQSGFAGLGEEGDHAGTDRGGGHEFSGKDSVPAFEAGFVVVGRIRLPDVGDDIHVSNEGVQDGGTGLAAILLMDCEP